MIRRYVGQLDEPEDMRNAHIRRLMADMSHDLILASYIHTTDSVSVTFLVQKKRSRAKNVTTVEYIVRAFINI